MARGFESKDVEFQQAEKERGRQLGRELTPEEREAHAARLTIELALAVFQQHDTMSKLLAAADNPQFVNESGDLLYMTPTTPAAAAPPPARLQYFSGTIYTTIVKSIKWSGEPINAP